MNGTSSNEERNPLKRTPMVDWKKTEKPLDSVNCAFLCDIIVGNAAFNTVSLLKKTPAFIAGKYPYQAKLTKFL